MNTSNLDTLFIHIILFLMNLGFKLILVIVHTLGLGQYQYHISGNIGDELNLAVWWSRLESPK